MAKSTIIIALLASFTSVQASDTIVTTEYTTRTTPVNSRIATVSTKRTNFSSVPHRETTSTILSHRTISSTTLSHRTTSSPAHTYTPDPAKCVMPADSFYNQVVYNPSFEYSYDGTDTIEGHSWPWDLSDPWEVPPPFNIMHDSAAIEESKYYTPPGQDGSYYAVLTPTDGPPSYILQFVKDLWGGVSYELEYLFYFPSNGLNERSKCALDVRLYYSDGETLDTVIDHIEFTHSNLKPYQNHYTNRTASYTAHWPEGVWEQKYLQVAWECTGWLDDDGVPIQVDNITLTAKCP